MVQLPVRLVSAFSAQTAFGMLLALSFATVTFVATPFLIPQVVDAYSVNLTSASFISVVQLGGFALASWSAGRFLTPTRTVLRAALVLAMAANSLCAVLPPFGLLLVGRSASGIALGVITWFAWANAFGTSQAMSKVAVIGPLIGVVSTPAVAFIISRSGMRTIFVILAVLPLVPLAFSATVGNSRRREDRTRHKALPAARVMLAALTAFALGGSAVYTFGVTVAERELGMGSNTVAVAYTLSSIVGIPSASWTGRRLIPGVWMGLTALCAFFAGAAFDNVSFFVGLVAWGFCYWMAVPGAYNVLAAVSAFPEERAGDAQAMMAAGRVVGPFLGGALIDLSGPVTLAAVGAGLMIAGGIATQSVKPLRVQDRTTAS